MADRQRRENARRAIGRAAGAAHAITMTAIPFAVRVRQRLAAIRIQTAFRGYAARTKYHLMRKGRLVWSRYRHRHVVAAKARGIAKEVRQRREAEDALHKRGHLLWAEGRNVAAITALRRSATEKAEARRLEQLRLEKARQAAEAKAAAARAAELAHEEELRRLEAERLAARRMLEAMEAEEQAEAAEAARQAEEERRSQLVARGHVDWAQVRSVEMSMHLAALARNDEEGPPPVPDFPGRLTVSAPPPVTRPPPPGHHLPPPLPSRDDEQGQKWRIGEVIDIDTEDGLEKGATILGPVTRGDPLQMRVKFADGAIDDWEIEEFRKPNAGAEEEMVWVDDEPTSSSSFATAPPPPVPTRTSGRFSPLFAAIFNRKLQKLPIFRAS